MKYVNLFNKQDFLIFFEIDIFGLCISHLNWWDTNDFFSAFDIILASVIILKEEMRLITH